jgi:photosystem II stability/assembly factor-like uncharacterized protein
MRATQGTAMIEQLEGRVLLSADGYDWSNVTIGGGGYVTGVEVHPVDPAVIYVRTDVGGFYRYDPEKNRLVQLMNWVPFEKTNLYGIAGLALHPQDPDILYVAAGMYDYSQAPADHEVFLSTDRGETFTPLSFPGRFGGNQTPDKYANMLALNPHDPNFLWAGTRGMGLWRYDTAAGSWSQVQGVPASGNNKVGPIVFDPANPQNMYVAVWNQGVYRSTNGGSGFTLIANSSSNVHDLAISTNGDRLYAANDDGLRRLDNPATSSNWLNKNTATGGPYRAVITSPHDNNTVLTARAVYGGLNTVSISTNAGDSWTRKQSVNVQQSIPWHPPAYPGSAIADFAWDPVNPGRVYFTDWYSFWHTDNIFASTVTWSNSMAHGHEEVVTLALAAPPSNADGVLLYSGHADVSGMRHVDLEVYPTTNFRSNINTDLTEVTGLAVAPSDHSRIYLVGSRGHDGTSGRFGWSDDFGKTWTTSPSYEAGWGWGRVAVSAVDKNRVVVVTRSGGVKFSTNGGQTWANAAGAPSSADMRLNTFVWHYSQPLTADAVNGNFYIYNHSAGTFHRSVDGGATWQQIASNLPRPGTHMWQIRSAPGQENHLWAAFVNNGLRRSTDGGASWQNIAGVQEVRLLALGVAAPGADYPAVYIYGRANGDADQWIYRSIDNGASWQRINDEGSRIGRSPQMIAADQVTFGRLYIGTNGIGVWVGQIEDVPVAPPAAPADLEAEVQGSDRIRLNWTGTVQDGFVLERSRSSSFEQIEQAINLPGNISSYTDQGLQPLTTYFYRIRAFNTAGHSQYSSIISATTAAQQEVEVLLNETFSAQGTGSVNLNTANPQWRATHRSVLVGSAAGNSYLDTWYDTHTYLIGAPFASSPYALAPGEMLRITIDYDASTLDSAGASQRTERVLFGLQAGAPISGTVDSQGTMSGFTPWNRHPSTQMTADWSGYQAVLRVDGSTGSGELDKTRIQRNAGPAPDATGNLVGSVWFQNIQNLAEASSFTVNGWRSARMVLYLDEQGNVIVELWEGPNRDALTLLSVAVDDKPDLWIREGFQHVVLGNHGTHGRTLFDNIVVDRVIVPSLAPPEVVTGQFEFQSRQAIRILFTSDVSGSLPTAGLSVLNLTTGQNITSGWTVQMFSDPGEPTDAAWIFDSGILPDGVYRATLAATDVYDGQGTTLADDHVLHFFVLAGDANRDGRVDIADMGILAANWQQSGRSFSQGDFNYTGAVDIADLGILAANWQVQLDLSLMEPVIALPDHDMAAEVASPAEPAPAAVTYNRRRPILPFSDEPIPVAFLSGQPPAGGITRSLDGEEEPSIETRALGQGQAVKNRMIHHLV